MAKPVMTGSMLKGMTKTKNKVENSGSTLPQKKEPAPRKDTAKTPKTIGPRVA